MKINMRITTIAAAMFAATATVGIYAKGGTAIAPSLFTVPTLPTPPYTAAQAAAIHGFDHTGSLQSATISNSGCPNETDPTRWGGTAKINNIAITVPCNLIIQMPANTYKWADMVNETLLHGHPSLNSYELSVVGNIVDGKYIAALMSIAQESLNGGSGVIQAIDYVTGDLKVSTGDPSKPAIIKLNDPAGRFGRAQSPDPRFSVDDENPSVHSGTGYPMCIPRTDPSAADDPLCPQKNRPKATATVPCRLFGQTGIVLPASGELSVTPAGQYCSQYVMKAPLGTKATTTVPAQYIATSASEPDARQQAPFEVGDFITFSGTLVTDSSGSYISAYSIEANVGIYTQPKSQPSYLAIGEFGVGSADPALIAVNGVGQETQDRIFFETETTDVVTPVDIYMVDVDPATGTEHNRWVSQFGITGECDPALALAASCLGVSGGITTQYTQAQPQRARVRVAKAPTGLLSQPSRNMRAMVRTLCKPVTSDLNLTTGHSASLDGCFATAVSKPVANGLVAGQYAAPVGEFIFPENVKQGDPIVPFDLWHLPFLVNGDADVGPLTPKAW